MKKFILIIGLLLLGAKTMNAREDDFPKLTDPYLGQKPPGITPEIFAPGIVSSDGRLKHGPVAISPDGEEAFWSIADPLTIFTMRLENGRWTRPETASFAVGRECSSPVFSPDGRRLFFTSQTVEDDTYRAWLWRMVKQKDGWSEPVKVDAAFNTGGIGYQVSLTKNGTLYFDSEIKGGRGMSDIYFSVPTDGGYGKPANVGEAINTELRESSVYVAPDESYMLFRRVQRVPGKDPIVHFFASFRNENGQWSRAVDIGEKLGVNANGFWIGGSPDGKYFFFVKRSSADKANVYWVDAKIIEGLRLKN
jgi:hypothetical protein